jgi:hypothetical protein
VNLFRFIPGYETSIYDAGREPAFLMLVAFIMTYAGTRFYTRMGRRRGWGSGSVGGVHLHHLVPGVVMSLAAGGLVIAFKPGGIPLGLLAVVFGAGAALTLDEFAMLLHLDDVYWTQERRLSIDACMTAVAFLGLALLATSPFEESGHEHGRWAAVAAIAMDGLLVVVTMLKGKLKMGLIGIIVPPVALVGALRVAKATSVRARLLYPKSGRRMRRSLARYGRRETRWATRRNRLYDLIGGTPARKLKRLRRDASAAGQKWRRRESNPRKIPAEARFFM